MASDRIHCEILRRAAEIAGGEDKLAQHLGVSSEDMCGWVQDQATAPAGIYIIAIDLISRSGNADDRARTRCANDALPARPPAAKRKRRRESLSNQA